MTKYIPKPGFPQTMYVCMKIFTLYDIHQSRGSNSKAITQLMCQVEGAIQTLPSLPTPFWTTVKQIFIDDGFSTEAMIRIRIDMTHNCLDISESCQSELGLPAVVMSMRMWFCGQCLILSSEKVASIKQL